MEYTKVEVKVNPVNQVVNEIVMAQMGEMGFDSFEETGDGFNAYIPTNVFDQVDFSLLVSPIDGIDLSFKAKIFPIRTGIRFGKRIIFSQLPLEISVLSEVLFMRWSISANTR